ncbi:hypothetical protein ABT095_17370 [Kitasatospora sp. NPDC002227]|uniref:hypothetical protein n=1 Tax=Kitasatospora sp. NPDC002227 TaxID=3154773 RepID=UPI003318558F
MTSVPSGGKWDAVMPQVIADYRADMTWAAISRKYGIPEGSIASLLARHGVVPDRKPPEERPEQAIVRLYVTERMSIRAIARRFKTSINTVRAVLLKADVKPRPPGRPRW